MNALTMLSRGQKMLIAAVTTLAAVFLAFLVATAGTATGSHSDQAIKEWKGSSSTQNVVVAIKEWRSSSTLR